MTGAMMRPMCALGSLLAVWVVAAGARAQPTVPVNIESSPAGATVFVDSPDGASIGVTPIRSARIPRGGHTLIFRLANHEEGRLRVEIRRWRETFRIVLNPLATINVTAGHADAEGAAVRVDGQPVGNIPHTMTVQPGRHLIQVGREGFQTFSQWADLTGGQVLALPVILQREAPTTGSILVAADVSGAPVFVDGTERGVTPTVLEGITAGQHTVEVRPARGDPFRQTVTVVAGQRAVVNATLRRRVETGSVRVICNVPEAVIRFDGEVLGTSPANRDEAPVGEHIVEASADGYEPVQQRVTVEAGRSIVVALEMSRTAAALGRIVVNASVAGATVTIDGEERGAAPIVVADATAGTHAVIVRADGHEEFRTTCEVGPGRSCEISADLQPIGTPVRVESNAPRARFYVDGEEMGPVPWEGTLPVGEHQISIRADGFAAYEAQVSLRATSEPRLFNVALTAEGDLTEDERAAVAAERVHRRREAVSRSASPLPGDMTVLDASIGWPYLAEVRLGVGVLEMMQGRAGLVAGFGMRTFGRLTEFEGRTHFGFRPIRQISLGAQLRIGGGLGPANGPTMEEEAMRQAAGLEEAGDHPTNSFFMALEGLFTLHFSRAGGFSLWLGMDTYSDRWDFCGRNSDRLAGDGCEPMMPMALDLDTYRERQKGVRLRLGGSLEIVINHHWNVWALFEGVIAGSQRRILGDVLGILGEDSQVYLRLGFTFKFGTERG